ncbi:MAG TPA: SRPBCC family protein, partial [Acidimicrobiia bacterium]|nr:SRPBCC family protein [Acidimicrobiia bacterium]
MARTEATIQATPERIFEVLMDPDCYGEWVVGSKYIRGADPDWPAVGSRFHHVVGVGPLSISDHTKIEEIDPPRLLKLRARARPLGTALVT